MQLYFIRLKIRNLKKEEEEKFGGKQKDDAFQLFSFKFAQRQKKPFSLFLRKISQNSKILRTIFFN